MKRPDTPLAPTPEPQPVSSGLQPMNNTGSQPANKYQTTADNAIQQIKQMVPATPAAAPSDNSQQQ